MTSDGDDDDDDGDDDDDDDDDDTNDTRTSCVVVLKCSCTAGDWKEGVSQNPRGDPFIIFHLYFKPEISGFTMFHDVSRCFTVFHDVSLFHDVLRCFTMFHGPTF